MTALDTRFADDETMSSAPHQKEKYMRYRHLLSAAAMTLAAACVAGAVASQAHDIGDADAPATTAEEAPFLAENGAAMDKMMADMHAKPTGDIDADFTAMMIPHHQGAIDMAVAYLRYGKNPQLRRLAQEIVVEQQQEIATMRLVVGEPLPPSVPAPTQPEAGSALSIQTLAHPAHDHSAVSHNAMRMAPAAQSEIKQEPNQ